MIGLFNEIGAVAMTALFFLYDKKDAPTKSQRIRY